MADDLKAGLVGARIEHDPRLTLERRIVDADVRPFGEAGEVALWVKFEVEEREWAKAGGRNAMSISFLAATLPPPVDPSRPTVILNIDAGYFPPSKIGEPLELLSQRVNLGISRLFTLNDWAEVARVAIEVAFPILQGLYVSALYDALKAFLNPTPHFTENTSDEVVIDTEFEFHNTITEEGDRRKVKRTAIIRTSDERVLQEALERFSSVMDHSSSVSEFNVTTHEWEEQPKD